MQPPQLSQIWIFPIKSLDGVRLEQVEILANGALAGDRTLALVDQDQKFVNGKRFPQIHMIRADYDLTVEKVKLRVEKKNLTELEPNFDLSFAAEFDLNSDRIQLAEWFSDYFGFKISVVENLTGGFPDDSISPAATLISTASLIELNNWFPNLSLEELRRRFRTNLEIANLNPFAEDRLFGMSDRTEYLIRFKIGAVQFLGINPCQRCVVPTRDSHNGESDPGFQKQFVTKRAETLPNSVERSPFNHFYRLAVNTRIDPQNQAKTLNCGDLLIV